MQQAVVDEFDFLDPEERAVQVAAFGQFGGGGGGAAPDRPATSWMGVTRMAERFATKFGKAEDAIEIFDELFAETEAAYTESVGNRLYIMRSIAPMLAFGTMNRVFDATLNDPTARVERCRYVMRRYLALLQRADPKDRKNVGVATGACHVLKRLKDALSPSVAEGTDADVAAARFILDVAAGATVNEQTDDNEAFNFLREAAHAVDCVAWLPEGAVSAYVGLLKTLLDCAHPDRMTPDNRDAVFEAFGNLRRFLNTNFAADNVLVTDSNAIFDKVLERYTKYKKAANLSYELSKRAKLEDYDTSTLPVSDETYKELVETLVRETAPIAKESTIKGAAWAIDQMDAAMRNIPASLKSLAPKLEVAQELWGMKKHQEAYTTAIAALLAVPLAQSNDELYANLRNAVEAYKACTVDNVEMYNKTFAPATGERLVAKLGEMPEA